ncbi:Na-translocating system protein MpsC family protein [Salicibibacter halophilus]|nr:Na-translocating system protein MpsC family protein [Salicibibacter halophilus]
MEKEQERKIVSYLGKLIRDHFGKGSTSLYVSITPPFLTVYLRGFISPAEQTLVRQKEETRVFETRNLLMVELFPTIKSGFWEKKINLKELYFDWKLEKHTGMIWGLIDNDTKSTSFSWPEHIDNKNLESDIIKMSQTIQKAPLHTEVFWINDRTVLIHREGIFVEIEKSLIELGYTEELRTAKRPLEEKGLYKFLSEPTLKKRLREAFFDWNFSEDKGHIILILAPDFNS